MRQYHHHELHGDGARALEAHVPQVEPFPEAGMPLEGGEELLPVPKTSPG